MKARPDEIKQRALEHGVELKEKNTSPVTLKDQKAWLYEGIRPKWELPGKTGKKG